jgi:hypothetical protein
MKRLWFVIVFGCCISPTQLIAQTSGSQEGTIVRMRMTNCPAAPQHMFTMVAAGSATPLPDDSCPEFTMVTEKVVYVVVGRSSSQFVPLAEVTRFHFQKKELLIRIEDANRNSLFVVKEMTLRADWDRQQRLDEEMMRAVAHEEQDAGVIVRNTR